MSASRRLRTVCCAQIADIPQLWAWARSNRAKAAFGQQRLREVGKGYRTILQADPNHFGAQPRSIEAIEERAPRASRKLAARTKCCSCW